jgi:enamine deaminase RidA (YjgF/YER057c/UK114 family)
MGMTMRQLISTGSPFEAKAGYSRAVVDGEWIFVSGTTGYDYATMSMPEDAAQQARNAFTTIEKALSQAGAGLKDVVRTVYILSSVEYAEGLFSVTGEIFRDIRPANTLFIAQLLRPEMKIEIEVTARKSAKP